MGFVASPGTKNDQLFSRRAPDAPALTKSVLPLPNDMLSLCSFHNELRHEQIFPLVCLSKQYVAPVLAEKIGNMWTDKIFGFSGSQRVKVAPSFWFLNINVPTFLLKPCSNGLRKTWFKFLGTSPSKCWPNSMRGLVCIAIGKSGFLKK